MLSQKRNQEQEKKKKAKSLEMNGNVLTYPYFCTLQIVGNDDVLCFLCIQICA